MWKVDFDHLFENYNNSRKWHVQGAVAALLFGDVTLSEITNVLFSCLSDFDATLDLIRFVESSLPANITFLGVLSVVSVEYPFDLTELAVSVEDAEGFLLVFADKTSLEMRDIDNIIRLNNEIDLRESTKSNSGLIIRTSLQLNVNINMCDKGSLLEEVSSAFFNEMDNIESLCFVLVDNGFILGRSKVVDTKQLNEKMSKMSNLLSNGKKFVDFAPLMPVNKDSDDSLPKLVPIVKIKKGLIRFCNVRASIISVAEVQRGGSPTEILTFLRRALKRTTYLTERCLCEFISFSSEHLINVRCGVFSTNDGLLSVIYPQIQDDVVLRNYRAKLHRIFNLPPDKPVLRPSQSLQFNRGTQKLLQNPHLHIKSYKPKGEVYVVNGLYNYHHYMQDEVDDNGWGCAYRSFQTIWSWFVLQGYIDKPVPTHREIQQSLHECGDKDADFVGSRQWIGSVELGYCLENMAGIESRMIATNSGVEVSENARQLAHHFKTYGTPVMIGGGMLAHTILGVDFNESSGESSFLVLDPHYSGDEDMHTVITKGWCGWKMPNFWRQEHFYNLLLPIPPQDAI